MKRSVAGGAVYIGDGRGKGEGRSEVVIRSEAVSKGEHDTWVMADEGLCGRPTRPDGTMGRTEQDDGNWPGGIVGDTCWRAAPW